MPNRPIPAFRLLPVLFLLGIQGGNILSQTLGQPGGLTEEALKNRIGLVENSTELSDSVRNLILDRYRQALADLGLAKTYDDEREALQETLHRTPAEIETIRNAIERQREVDPTLDLRISENVGDEELERLLENEMADLNTTEARLKNLESAMEEALKAPAVIRDRKINARLLLEETGRQGNIGQGVSADPLAAEAARWSVQAKALALEAEIRMLDQKLLGNRSKERLIRYQWEEAQQNIRRIQSRLEMIRGTLRDRRQLEMEAASEQADSILEREPPGPVVLAQLAEENLRSVATYQEQLFLLDSLERLISRLLPLQSQLTNAYLSAQRKIKLNASGAPLGRIVREERQHFPQMEAFLRGKREVNRHVGIVSLRLIQSEEERRALRNPGAFLEKRLRETGSDTLDALSRAGFQALASTRLDLLGRNISHDVVLERELYEINGLFDQLIQKVGDYDAYLDENLLWIRSTPPFQLRELTDLPGEIVFFLSPKRWANCGRELIEGFLKNPFLLLVLMLAAVLIWLRKRIRDALAKTGRYAWHPGLDRISSTLEALVYTLLIALPLPLLLWSAGSSLSFVPEEDLFPRGISRGLVRTAHILLLLSFIRALFLTGGLADLHMGWSKARLTEMRRILGRLMGIGLPFYFLTVSFANVFPVTQGGIAGILFFTGYMLTLAWFGYAFSHPTKGMARYYLEAEKGHRQSNWFFLLFALAVIIPLALVGLALAGFTFTAVEFYLCLEWSVWLFTALWLVAFIGRKWLVIMREKFVYEKLREEREAAQAARREAAQEIPGAEPAVEEKEDPRAELASLDNDTRQLFNAALLVTAVIGLAGIWGGMLPALGVLEEILLWENNFSVGEVDYSSTITLADLLKAIFYGIIALILGKNLPSLVNILLIKRGKTSSGSRYAISTLLKYTIALFGTLAVLGTLGLTTAQLGWAAAALSVGIGFGLQEIVANFVSGIILLFERPVRIGDVVTIGEATGTVTQIQIRATTIRDWDRREFLVPNKELIAGRLINWTLSDKVIRAQVKVGVAYGSDVEKAMELMRKAAVDNPRVLKDPVPYTWFDQFGDSALQLTLNIFVDDVLIRLAILTELNQEINRSFKENGIEIAFPQLDVHVRSNGEKSHSTEPVADKVEPEVPSN